MVSLSRSFDIYIFGGIMQYIRELGGFCWM